MSSEPKPEWRANDPDPPSLDEMHAALRQAPTPLERMGEGTISWYASTVADGTASREDAKGLLIEFVRQVRAGEKASPRLLEHMADCISAFLDGRRTLVPTGKQNRPITVPIPNLEKALGIKRVAPGNPEIDEDTFAEVAMEVLRRRLAGKSLESAAADVAEDRKARGARVSSESQIKEAWPKYAQQGMLWLRIANERPFTPAEEAKLNEMFWGKLWFVPPGADAKQRQTAILAALDLRRTDEEIERLAKLDGAETRTEYEAELVKQQADRERRAVEAARKFDAPYHPKIRRNTSD